MKRTTKKLPPQETVADFKARLAALLRGQNEQIGGTSRTWSPLVRKPTDRGYYPPTKK